LLLWLLLRQGGGWSSSGGAARCVLRVDAAGIRMNGQGMSAEQAPWVCRAAGATAEVAYTGDAIYGQVQRLIDALSFAQVPTMIRRP
jgi:hypothetical protein